jgi:hypothetical protein
MVAYASAAISSGSATAIASLHEGTELTVTFEQQAGSEPCPVFVPSGPSAQARQRH